MLVRPMKTQLTSSDARTDRLVRQLRAEIDTIRSTLDELADGHEELLELDAAAVAADPAAAATLPPPLLVRTIIRLEREREALEEEAREKAALLRALGDQHQALQLKETSVRARLETLEDVISALHANLEDLRIARALTGPGGSHALRIEEPRGEEA
jgi:DNA repair exonuclease SbcCD ATPase subunit